MNTQVKQPSISFGQLFKFFRIQAGFTTVAKFADALADHNIVYCESLYYHWQRDNKVPNNRKLLLQIVSVFIDYGSIENSYQVNAFLESAEKGYLTKSEILQFSDLVINPSEKQIAHFESSVKEFIELQNLKKSGSEKYKKRTPKQIRFNCMLEETTNKYLSKIAKKNNTTKSDFIRQLILEHQNKINTSFASSNNRN